MKEVFKGSTMLSPVPAVMVSCGKGENANIITIAWTGIINSDPPLTYISVRESRYSHKIIDESRCFTINLTTEDLAFATDFAGVKSGKDINKFKELNLTPIPCQEIDSVMIKESPINLECRVIEKHEYNTHHMFVAEIVKIHVEKDLIDEDGRIDFETANLIAYVHGHYYGIKKKAIGRFGYSVMKPKTRKRINRENHQKKVISKKGKRRT